MSRTAGTVFAALFSLSAAAQAAETQIVVTASDPQEARTKLYEAADKLCAAARSNDPMGDYGTQEECVANSVYAARRTYVSRSAR
ncbi:MAG: hypothetical protein WDN04_02280 [Rhodospirillales bacterium]